MSRPRVRLTVTGGMLLVIGGLIISNSVWTLPLVIVGALMVAIAWVGHRLDGRFVIEWGEAGTEIAFRATLKPAHPANDPPSRFSSQPLEPVLEPRPGPESAQVIDGEAHTVEIDIAELKALIAAAENGDAQGDAAGNRGAAGNRDAAGDAAGESAQDIQIRRATSGSAHQSPANRMVPSPEHR